MVNVLLVRMDGRTDANQMLLSRHRNSGEDPQVTAIHLAQEYH